MKRKLRCCTPFAFMSFICFGLLDLSPVWGGTNISETDKYAWSENAGWLNWRSTHAQATVGPTYLLGYVWAENIGWIKLGSAPSGGTYENTTSSNWGVNLKSDTGELYGYAWSETTGWINFNPTHGGVTINPGTGEFDGYAWSESIGWIHFQNTYPAYAVRQVETRVLELASFAAKACEEHISLDWETASEMDTYGFHLWRSPEASGEYTKITDVAIPGEGGFAQGTTYTYEDAQVEPGVTYHYKLEHIDYSGSGTFHGPVSAWIGMVNIQANGSDDAIDVSPDVPVSVTIGLNPGEREGWILDWWITAGTGFEPPRDWYAYVHPDGWSQGFNLCVQAPLFPLSGFEILNTSLSPGRYTFYFVLDPPDGRLTAEWLDYVTVNVAQETQ